jgi:hypothetical protein
MDPQLLVALVVLLDFLYATFESRLGSETLRSRTSICPHIFDPNPTAFFRFGPIPGTSSSVSESTSSDLMKAERVCMAALCRARSVRKVPAVEVGSA